MKTLERTRQQLDPVGTLSARTLALVLAGGAFVYAVAMSVVAADQIVNPALAVFALVLLGGASITVWRASAPSRAPFTATSHALVHVLVLGSIALSVASQWGVNKFVQDDFGPISLGLLMLAMGVYRPARELASAGMISATFVGFITLLEVPTFVTTAPPVSFVVVGMTPILALSFASASYSGSIVNALERWQSTVRKSVDSATSRLTEGITKSIRENRVNILAHEVFPFFSDILSKETITHEDRARAREIGDTIRALMVGEADRTWLEVVAADDGVPLEEMHRSVDDPNRRASSMETDQRAVLRALILALLEEPEFRSGSLKVTISGTPARNHGTLVTALGNGSNPREQFAPYFAVMRIVFSDVLVDFRDGKLTVGFSYEQR